jgi:hypothetical protein
VEKGDTVVESSKASIGGEALVGCVVGSFFFPSSLLCQPYVSNLFRHISAIIK